MVKSKGSRSYEDEVLSVLAFEFSVKDHAESERKLKRRLREKGLGSFDGKRISGIRKLKDDIQAELEKAKTSKFFAGSTGKYSNRNDWDVDGLLSHLKKNHPDVSEAAIDSFLPYAIYIYYLR